jgi:nucleoside-diphosphate-sugar epimerase
MRVLVTGTSGHIGSFVAQRARRESEVIGVDIRPGPWTTHLADIRDRRLMTKLLSGVDAVVHLAALLTPHVRSRTEEDFRRINIEGTRILLNCSLAAGVRRFIFTSTTSVYGCSTRASGRAVWVTEELDPNPEDIYDVTKLEAESLCRMAACPSMSCIVLRLSRCFPEAEHLVAFYRLYRGVDPRDAAECHQLALTVPLNANFELFNLSARSSFGEQDCDRLWADPWSVVERLFPAAKSAFQERDWPLPQRIDRVYVVDRARKRLGYDPRFNFGSVLTELRANCGQ